ncbi:NusG domain II-containing protein [Lutispora saccharofermentans]|uniref:NusG domain II-containing protein n=1 Tax=Lutispora saccharofermentans TaxID=3024236 RepID=A0ABT1NNN2_9FIRM|nr:NusG domain II-containing protein [Lutispora saccharofermentans]MCQ1531541.1 NusG domain II-containing protein [Lutispora saccharofermentans]
MIVKLKKGDILLLLIVLIAGISYFGLKLLYKDTGNKTVVISVNGKEYERVDMRNLSSEKLIHIELEEGRYIDIKADSKGAYVSDVVCPDKICQKTGVIDRVGQSIVCLPNKVQVFIEGNEKADVDGVSQ